MGGSQTQPPANPTLRHGPAGALGTPTLGYPYKPQAAPLPQKYLRGAGGSHIKPQTSTMTHPTQSSPIRDREEVKLFFRLRLAAPEFCTAGNSQETADRSISHRARVKKKTGGGVFIFSPVLKAGAGKKNFPKENPLGIVREIFLYPNSLKGKSEEFKIYDFPWGNFSLLALIPTIFPRSKRSLMCVVVGHSPTMATTFTKRISLVFKIISSS
jgi:hypothetical protein